jgi:hypothetical protein
LNKETPVGEHQKVEQFVVVPQAAINPHQTVHQLALFNDDGTVRSVPKQAAAQADVGALTSAAATGGESPTEAEYNALRTDLVNTRTVVNSLLAKLRTAGVIAT